jgi:hypothetical protein
MLTAGQLFLQDALGNRFRVPSIAHRTECELGAHVPVRCTLHRLIVLPLLSNGLLNRKG